METRFASMPTTTATLQDSSTIRARLIWHPSRFLQATKICVFRILRSLQIGILKKERSWGKPFFSASKSAFSYDEPKANTKGWRLLSLFLARLAQCAKLNLNWMLLILYFYWENIVMRRFDLTFPFLQVRLWWKVLGDQTQIFHLSLLEWKMPVQQD